MDEESRHGGTINHGKTLKHCHIYDNDMTVIESAKLGKPPISILIAAAGDFTKSNTKRALISCAKPFSSLYHASHSLQYNSSAQPTYWMQAMSPIGIDSSEDSLEYAAAY
uniref:Uncharacterized protein n=1 Tax=Glossina pallidipes TaxID=7398 RepID=A0A1A9ZK84_GLOPL